MKQLFKNGEVVLFSTGGGRKTNIGMILKYKESEDEYAVLTIYSSVYKNIRTAWISPLSDKENVRKEISSYWESKIKEAELQLRKPTQEEKDNERVEKYEELKKQIKTVARRLAESNDDADFENRLKAISDMKKNIFSIELECVFDIRIQNGKIKWKIRELIQNKESELKKISDESIEKTFTF